MTERDSKAGEPETSSPAASAWSQRMESQATPASERRLWRRPAKRTKETERTRGTERTKEIGPLAPSHRERPSSAVGVLGAGRSGRRRGVSGLATIALLLVATLVVVAIVLGNRERNGTSSNTANSPAATAATDLTPTDGATLLPTDPAATDGATLPPVDPGLTTPAPTPTPAAPVAAGDLGLSEPMSTLTCDGSWITLVGSASDPAAAATAVSGLMAAHPGSHYTLTAGGCTALRQSLPDGRSIYAVYLGPFPDPASACAAATQAGGGAYVKRLDAATPPEQAWTC